MNWIKQKWSKISGDPKTIRNFGLILSGILFVLGVLAFWRKHNQYQFEWPLSGIVLVITLAAPRVLSYIYRAWMLIAEGISWVLLRVILGMFFYLILSPVGFLMRLSGRDMLDEKIDHQALSYWKKKISKSTQEQYERLF